MAKKVDFPIPKGMESDQKRKNRLKKNKLSIRAVLVIISRKFLAIRQD